MKTIQETMTKTKNLNVLPKQHCNPTKGSNNTGCTDECISFPNKPDGKTALQLGMNLQCGTMKVTECDDDKKDNFGAAVFCLLNPPVGPAPDGPPTTVDVAKVSLFSLNIKQFRPICSI